MTSKLVFHALWVTMMLSVGAALLLVHDFLRNLKHNHPTRWHELGEPSLFLNNSLRNNFLVLQFLFRKEYLHLKDHIVEEKAERVLKAYIVALVLFVVTFVALPVIGW